jgi:hypothetical protein
MSRRALAAMLMFLLAGIPNLLPLGAVTRASGAHFNVSKVSAGATIYEGDRLSTGADGALQVRGSAALLYLPGASGVTLHGLPMGAQSRLQAGTVVFSTAKAAVMEILANGAFIRPVAVGPTLAQVTMVGPKELQISARRGALQFGYAGETEEIAEGRTRKQKVQNHHNRGPRLGQRMEPPRSLRKCRPARNSKVCLRRNPGCESSSRL